MYTLRVLNSNLTHKETLENIRNPLIYEQYNSDYRFSFETPPKTSGFLFRPDVDDIIEVDGDYFQLARMVKDRGSSVSIKVEMEHVSYQMNEIENYIEEFEDTPTSILQQLINIANLMGHNFTIGTVDFTNTVQFRPGGETPIRSCIIDLAKQLNGDLYWNKHSVSILQRRGKSNGPTFEVGENIIGMSVTIENEKGIPVTSYEIDVLDLAHMPEYSFLKNVQLGDTVGVIDPELGVNERIRVVSHEFNPFQKVNSKVQIAHIPWNYTDYIQDVVDEMKNGETEADKQELITLKGTGHMVGSAILKTKWDGYWMEFGTAPLAGHMEFYFKDWAEYDEVHSITTGIRGGAGYSSNVTIVCDTMVYDDMVWGIQCKGNWGDASPPPLEVSIQAICRILDKEEGD